MGSSVGRNITQMGSFLIPLILGWNGYHRKMVPGLNRGEGFLWILWLPPTVLNCTQQKWTEKNMASLLRLHKYTLLRKKQTMSCVWPNTDKDKKFTFIFIYCCVVDLISLKCVVLRLLYVLVHIFCAHLSVVNLSASSDCCY